MNEFGEKPKKIPKTIVVEETPKKEEKKLSKKEAISLLWEMGSLQYKLKGKQVELYQAFKEANEHINVICASRRWGKSTVLCLVSVELCLQKPNSVVKYVCPTKVQATEILESVMRPILEDCPPAFMPQWMEAKKRYIFPNGSQIQIWAADNGAIDSARGGVTDLGIVDEAGFCDRLDYVVDSVLSPGTDTVGGKIILASTPNYLDVNHVFNMEYVLPRQELGTLKKFTIHDAPMISEKRKQEIIDRYGVDNPKYRCEYLCEIAVDVEKQVFSEFSPEKEKEIIIQSYPKPMFFDCYVSMDIGFKDLTVVLFAWFDFVKSTIVVEDELVISGSELNTEYLAQLIKEKELTVFKDKIGLPKTPTLRVADNNNPILLNDLYRLHNLMFLSTAKDQKDAQVNEVKLRIKQNRIIINARCKHLIYHLRSAKWDKNHKGFERVRDDRDLGIKGGHVDAVDALIYLVRNVSTAKNPFPDGYYDLKGENVYNAGIHDPYRKTQGASSFVQQILNIRKNKK